MSFETIETDILVVGSGLAGTMAAIRAAELGQRVVLVSSASEASSQWAQGVIVMPDFADRESLRADILKAGCGINNPEAIQVVLDDGERIIKSYFLERFGMPFDRKETGELDLVMEAAHSKARILHMKDRSGAGIMKTLENVRSQSGIVERSGILIDLLVSDRHDARPNSIYRASRCQGAYFLDPVNGSVFTIVAKSTVLATGGFSQLFHHSTGPNSARGDGISAAHRAGAKTLHMEYVQFHPTALYIPNERRYLLTEALRGAGARLLNQSKKTFIDELAPRDIVARAIHSEMLKDNSEHVWIDLSPISDFENRFPTIHALLTKFGFDAKSDLIPVVPAAHYTIGGIWSDRNARSSLDGLWVAGEVACTGLHGANRLASTSLLEAVVFGFKAGEDAAALSRDTKIDFIPRDWEPSNLPVDPALVNQDWDLLKKTLWNYIGLVRSPSRLLRAERILLDLRRDVESFYRMGMLSEQLVSLRHAVLVSTLLLYAAMRNRKSLGTHFIQS
jgi:L-aspartate oxidase